MEKIIDFYLNNEMGEEVVIGWLQGAVISEMERPEECIDLTTISASSFAEQFTDKLHQSLDWLLKQTVNVPINRTPLTVVNKKSSTINENFQKNLNINDHNSFPSLDEASSKLQVKPANQQTLTKRIKPTLVSQSRAVPSEQNSTFQNVNYGKGNPSTSTSADSYKEERELLKNVREKRFSEKPATTAAANSTATISQSQTSRAPRDPVVKQLTVIKPKYAAATCKEEIVKLKTLYIQLLMNNHTTSLLEEIKFIIAVINKRATSESAELSTTADRLQSIFSSYHNCFYFVYLAFEDLFIEHQFINLLSFKAVEQIKSNRILMDYQVDDCEEDEILENLKELIERCYLGQTTDEQQNAEGQNSTEDDDFVYFQPDTDDKSNFPNDQSFYVFRKQRDDFYRLLKRYTEGNWSASIAGDLKVQATFTSFINGILGMSKDVGNYYHLARLFISQLLKSCSHRQRSSSSPSSKKTAGPEQINRGGTTQLSTNEEKYRKLQDRFERKPRNVGADNSNSLLEEAFTERERFFSDLIYYGDSHCFNEQLKLILKSQILANTSQDMNSFVERLLLMVGENDGGGVDSGESSTSLLAFLGRIHLLAKFFGFLVFYPLNTSLKVVNEKEGGGNSFASQQKSLRSSTPAEKAEGEAPIHLDLESYLLRMMEKHYLVVAVPWVVEFLTFIDPITLTMPYYEGVLGLLCLIYKYYLPRLSALTMQRGRQQKYHNSPSVSYTRLFIQLYLERLFAAKKFNAPERLQALAENTANPGEVCAAMFQSATVRLMNGDRRSPSPSSSGDGHTTTIYLDFHNDIFDFEQMAAFFPHFSRLVELQFKLQASTPFGGGINSISSSENVRKITPTCVTNKPLSVAVGSRFSSAAFTSSSASSSSLPSSNLLLIQQQAEECFLNTCSKSLRNCIKFVIERVTSAAIKAIKREGYPKAKEVHFAAFLRENGNLFSAGKEPSEGGTKVAPAGGIPSVDPTARLAATIRADCKAFLGEYADAKLKVLLPHVVDLEELDESVSRFSVHVCLRAVRQTVGSWIELNLTTETVNADLMAYGRGGGGEAAAANQPETAKTSSPPFTSEDVFTAFAKFERLLYDLRTVLCTINGHCPATTSSTTAKLFSPEGQSSTSADSLQQATILQLLRRVQSLRRCPHFLLLPPVASNASLLDQLTLDLALSLVAFRPHLLTDELLDGFTRLWAAEAVTHRRVLCLKTVHLLTRSPASSISTWLKFEFLLSRLLVAGVVTFSELAESAEAVLKESWPPAVLAKYASLLQALVDCAQSHDLFDYDSAAHQLVDWLAWFVAQKEEEEGGALFDLPE